MNDRETVAFMKFSKGLNFEDRKFLIKEYQKIVKKLQPISKGGQRRCIL